MEINKFLVFCSLRQIGHHGSKFWGRCKQFLGEGYTRFTPHTPLG
jgi:hypothetical protein